MLVACEGLKIYSEGPFFRDFTRFSLVHLSRRFCRTDPGLEKVGKIAKDGNPMTILDIARQGDFAFEGPVTYAFCASCEVNLTNSYVCVVFESLLTFN